MDTIDSFNLMRVAKAYVRLGTAVQEQVDRVIEEGPFDLDGLRSEGRLNPNALRNAKHFFEVYDKAVGEDEALWDDIANWLDELEGD